MTLKIVNNGSQIILSPTIKANKYYTIDRTALKSTDYLGAGATGSVIKAKCTVEDPNVKKEKQYAIKIFYSLFNKNPNIEEFDCHGEIMRRLNQHQSTLCQQGITVGTGIEKKPLFAFSIKRSDYIMKKLYDNNLNAAIQQGCFQNTTQLRVLNFLLESPLGYKSQSPEPYNESQLPKIIDFKPLLHQILSPHVGE